MPGLWEEVYIDGGDNCPSLANADQACCYMVPGRALYMGLVSLWDAAICVWQSPNDESMTSCQGLEFRSEMMVTEPRRLEAGSGDSIHTGLQLCKPLDTS